LKAQRNLQQASLAVKGNTSMEVPKVSVIVRSD
jgi:hypothetical protein